MRAGADVVRPHSVRPLREVVVGVHIPAEDVFQGRIRRPAERRRDVHARRPGGQQCVAARTHPGRYQAPVHPDRALDDLLAELVVHADADVVGRALRRLEIHEAPAGPDVVDKAAVVDTVVARGDLRERTERTARIDADHGVDLASVLVNGVRRREVRRAVGGGGPRPPERVRGVGVGGEERLARLQRRVGV